MTRITSMRATSRRLLLLFLFFLLSSCTYIPSFPYKIDIQQGNVVTEEMVAQLKPGMTPSQVRFTLGTPLITDVFHGDRWDYIYRFAPSARLTEEQQLTVFFENGRLVHIQGDLPQPPAFSKLSKTEFPPDETFGAVENHENGTSEESGQSRTIDFLKENRTNFYEGNQ